MHAFFTITLRLTVIWLITYTTYSKAFEFKTYDKKNTRLFLPQEQRSALIQKWQNIRSNNQKSHRSNKQESFHVVYLSTPNRHELWPYTKKSIENYCLAHNYTFHFFNHLIDQRYVGNWNKMFAVECILKQTTDNTWVVWIDDDIVLTNPDILFSDIVALCDDNKKIIIGEDMCLHKGQPCSTGIFLIKNCSETRAFINHLWNYGIQRGYLAVPSLMDQDAFSDLVGDYDHYATMTQILPLRILQSFYANQRLDETGKSHWQPGDFMAHFAALETTRRVQLVKEFCAQHTSNTP